MRDCRGEDSDGGGVVGGSWRRAVERGWKLAHRYAGTAGQVERESEQRSAAVGRARRWAVGCGRE